MNSQQRDGTRNRNRLKNDKNDTKNTDGIKKKLATDILKDSRDKRNDGPTETQFFKNKFKQIICNNINLSNLCRFKNNL